MGSRGTYLTDGGMNPKPHILFPFLAWQKMGWGWGTGPVSDPFSREKIGQVPIDTVRARAGPGHRHDVFPGLAWHVGPWGSLDETAFLL